MYQTIPHPISHPSEASIEVLESRIAPAFSSPIDLSSLTDANGGIVNGETSGDQSGWSVSEAGDVNRDGIPDFIIGARHSAAGGGFESGAVYVIFGTGSGLGMNFQLSALNGDNGFRVTSPLANEKIGWAVAAAGDINRDGFDDILIGERGTDTTTGAAYVIFGKASGFAASINVAALTGTDGFKLTGVGTGSDTGYDVAGLGDFNHDGFDDIAISAVDYDSHGRVYVVFGKATPWAANLNLSTLNGTNGFSMDGALSEDNFGYSVAGAGDLNRDGIPDLVIGANAVDVGAAQNFGAAFVVYGTSAPFSATFNVTALNGTNGFKVLGSVEGEGVGCAVAGIRDINGDGFDDIAIGAYRSEPHGAWSGATYVVFGAATVPAATFTVLALDGSNGFKISGEGFSDFSGWQVAAAGDVNGDGFADLAIGAPRYGTYGKILCGGAYVVYGNKNGFAANLELSTVDGSNGIKFIGASAKDYAGASVSGIGDVNGDGFDDLLIGAYQTDPNGHVNAGSTYVIYGKQSISANIDGSGKAATFEGADGKLVTVSVSKGNLTSDNLVLRGLPGGGAELLRLDLSDSMFEGATVKITGGLPLPLVKSHNVHPRADGVPHLGTGFVNIGLLWAPGVDLGKVTVDGDVARIVAGDDNLESPAFKTLTVNSLGLTGTRLLIPDDVGPTEISGAITTLKIATDVKNMEFDVQTVKTLTIGGSVENLDLIATTLGTVKITGSVNDSLFELQGIDAPKNASAATALKSLTVSGSFVRSALLAGYNPKGDAVNNDVAVGTVQVNGNWVESDLAVGIAGGDDGQLGSDDDILIPGGNDRIIAKIAKLIIKGDAYGSSDEGDFFAIEAEQFGSATIGKMNLALSKQDPDGYLIGDTYDLRFQEVTRALM
jgi:hypothetical protein